MKNETKPRKRTGLLLVALLAGILVIACAGLVGFRLVTGQSLGLRSWVNWQIYFAKSAVRASLDSRGVKSLSNGQYTNVLFLHHSVGHNIIYQGGLRELLSQKGYELSDQDYLEYGLKGPDGQPRGYTYLIPNDNTDPDGLAAIFSQKALPLPLNAFSGLLQYEVILAKSCFPANAIQTDDQLERMKQDYLKIRLVIEQHPDRFFVLMTIPPLNPRETTPEAADRARVLANWLASTEYSKGLANLAVFDLFSALAENDPAAPGHNTLRSAYQDGTDSHPNRQGSQDAAKALAAFIDEKVSAYRAAHATAQK